MVGKGGQRWAKVGRVGMYLSSKQKRWLPQPTVGESLNFSTMRICPASRRERTQPAIGIGNAATAKKAVTTRVSASRDYIGTKLGAAQRRPGRQSQVRDGELHHHRAPLCDGFSVQVMYNVPALKFALQVRKAFVIRPFPKIGATRSTHLRWQVQPPLCRCTP